MAADDVDPEAEVPADRHRDNALTKVLFCDILKLRERYF